MSNKQIHTQLTLSPQTHGTGFQSVGVNQHQLNLDPLLNIDLFHMSQPTFPPHPHAGFSAVTYLLPESQGAFQNRDSLGEQCLIAPGSVHWTQAGSGVMHEEIPTVPGVDVWGFQIFVNLHHDVQRRPPRIWHADAAEIPVLASAEGVLRVVAGSYGGQASPLNALDTQVDLWDIQVSPHQSWVLDLVHPYAYFVFGIAGAGQVAEHAFGAQQVATLSGDGKQLLLSAGAEGLRLLVGGGVPLQQPVFWDGPFAMSTRADTLQARQRFLAGAMGRLTPSF
ncbi:MAG: pirin family protein [Candidatus Sericytochromatia bacterium]